MPAHDHLLVDRVVVLRPTTDRGLDLRDPEIAAHHLPDRREVLLPSRSALGDQVDDLLVHLRVQLREREILELPLDRVHPEAVSERCVDLEGLSGLPLSRGGRDVAPGPSIVQPVCQLDHQYPDVPGHGHHHLANGLGLGRVPVGDPVELRDAVHQHRDLGPELRAQSLERVVGVLDRVVQERRRKGRRRHAELTENGRDRHRVRDVRVAALAVLTTMSFFGHRVRAGDEAQVRLGMVVPHRGKEGFHRGRDGTGSAAESHQSGPDPAPRDRNVSGSRGRRRAGVRCGHGHVRRRDGLAHRGHLPRQRGPTTTASVYGAGVRPRE